MARTGIGFRIVTAVVALALTAFSLGFTWAVVDDYTRREVVPKGAAVEGLPVGGLTRAEAVKLVQDRVESLLLQPLTVTFRGKTFTLEADKYLTVDVEGMVDDTFRVQEQATLPERVYRRITGESVPVNVTRKLKLDTKGLQKWAATTARGVDTAAIDSTLTVVKERVNVSKAVDGYQLNRSKTVNILSAALRDGRRDVNFAVNTIKPGVNENSFGKTILVVKHQTHLYLYDGPKLIKDYPIACGMPAHPTPSGWWVIENKRYMPSWTNNGSAWAAGMPAYIAPGYNNPLGTRALDLNASGIRIHGTANDASIGTDASHGCMRMHMPDIEDLYDRVQVGTRVIIID
jgi:lipoprotein-anchoring transpeptidase ErfK/SrfK